MRKCLDNKSLKIYYEPQNYRACSLEEVLEERENRVALRKNFIRNGRGYAYLSLNLNIAGPKKRSPLSDCFFSYVLDLLLPELKKKSFLPTRKSMQRSVAGLYLLLECQACSPMDLKSFAIELEQRSPAMRLVDLDVYSAGGEKLSRGTLFPKKARKCFLCDRDAFACSRSQRHSEADLLDKINSLMRKELQLAFIDRLVFLAEKAMREEVLLTPKPGLVDRANNGAHRDMDMASFFRSIEALKPYLKVYAKEGLDFYEREKRMAYRGQGADVYPRSGENAGQVEARGYSFSPDSLHNLFKKLQRLGKSGEKASLAVNGGVNCHKGLHYALALLLPAAVILFAHNIDFIAGSESASLSAPDQDLPLLVEQEEIVPLLMPKVRKIPELAARISERAYRLWREEKSCELPGGARAAAAHAYPDLMHTGLPVLEKMLESGFSEDIAGLVALLHLYSRVEDSNIIRRGGQEALLFLQNKARLILKKHRKYKPNSCYDGALQDDFSEEKFLSDLRAFDEELIGKNLSPGGSADLLALSLFLSFLGKNDTLC